MKKLLQTNVMQTTTNFENDNLILTDKFINFINENFFSKLNKDFIKLTNECGYIDIINSQGYKYLIKSNTLELIDQAWSNFVTTLIEEINNYETQKKLKNFNSESNEHIFKIQIDNSEYIIIPLFLIDEEIIHSKKLSLSDQKIFKDNNNYFKIGYIYFKINFNNLEINTQTLINIFFQTLANTLEQLIQLYNELNYKTREANDYQLLLDVSASIISSLNLNDVLQGIVNGATQALKSARGSLMLIDETTGELVLRYGKGLKPELINNVRTKVGEGIAGTVAKTGMPILIRDIEQSDKFRKKSSNEFNNKSLLSVPLKVKENVIGVFNINNKLTGDIYNELDLKLLQALSNQAAIAIQNAKNYQKMLETQAELEEQIIASSNLYEEVHTLYEIIRATTSLNDPKSDPHDRILDLATKTLGAVTGFLFLPSDNNTLKAAYIKGEYNKEFQFSTINQNEENLITSVIKSLQSVLITTLDNNEIKIEPEIITPKQYYEDPLITEFSQFINQPIKTMLIVPLFDEKFTSIGVILLLNKLNSENFTEPNRNLLQILGQQISSIIRDKKLLKEYLMKQTIEKEIDVAHNIQQKLLPKSPPKINEIDISAIYEPAKTMSGDYYDFFIHDTKGEKIGFVIADVSGKGIPAAMIMSMTKAILKTQVVNNFSPSNILHNSNNFILPDMENNRYVTMFYGILDINTLEFTYSKAGHNPPYWLHYNTNTIEELDCNGFFLGMFEDASYEEKKIQLQKGDKLILFTDGIIEAMNEQNEEYGHKRFTDIIKKYYYFDSKSLIDKILMDVKNFVGNTQQSDDITLLVVGINNFNYDELILESKTSEIVKAAEFFGNLVTKHNLPIDKFEIMMIIDEVLMNAIEHGNKFDPEKKVFIKYVVNDYKFEIIVKDEGEGFKVNEILSSHEKISLYNKRGRGLLIVKNLVDIVEYNKSGNEVRIVKYFK